MTTWKKWLLAALIVAAAAFCIGAAVLLQPKQETQYIAVTLEGERMQTLPVGGSFTDPGASALYYCGDAQPVEVKVSVTGSVDPSRLGTYLLCYTARWEDCLGTAYRQIRITDTSAPVITLVENPDSYTLPGHSYEEEGFSARDDYDGDLTARVRRKDHTDHIVYTVKDSSGNETTVTRTVRFHDPIPPELKLKGSDRLTLTAGSTFREPGWEAVDNCDGDLSGKVSVSGQVNTQTPGTYVLNYTVMDSYQNVVTVQRTVVVEEKKTQSGTSTVVPLPDVSHPEGDRVIFLTFDDGPSKYTPKLLDVLKKYNVKATFFVVNTYFTSTIKRIYEEGHTVAIHTASHEYGQIYQSEEAYFADLYRMQDIIREHTGHTSTILRFPGGTSNSVSKKYNPGIMTRLSQQVKDLGFRYFDWNVPSGDTDGHSNAQTVYERVVKGVQKHQYSVVLQHDIKGFSVDAVESIILWGLRNGYTFQALTMDSPPCEHTPTN